MSGKRLTFLYTSPYEHVEYKVSGPYVNFFVFSKCSEIKIFTIIFVVKSIIRV